MKKIWLIIFAVSTVILTSVGVEASSYSINITKYDIPTTMSDKIPVNSDTIVNSDDLKPVMGEKYRVVAVELKSDNEDNTQLSSYTEIVNGYNKEMSTDNDGRALFSGLSEGTYIVYELESDYVTRPMDPVIVNLPMEIGNQLTDTVYIYPKSNIVNYDKVVEKIPQSSGDLGSNLSLLVLMILPILSLFVVLKKTRNV